MLRLHFYSNVVRLREEEEDEEEEVYRIDQIKEFERVDPAWKEIVAEYLLRGVPLDLPLRDSLSPLSARSGSLTLTCSFIANNELVENYYFDVPV